MVKAIGLQLSKFWGAISLPTSLSAIWPLLRWLVTGLVALFIWQALVQLQHELTGFRGLTTATQWIGLAGALALLPINLGLEAMKFWVLIKALPVTYTLGQAFRGVLAGLTTGFPTPNRWGEYIGRCAFLPAEHRLSGTLALFVARSSQLLPTAVCGIWGLSYLGMQQYGWPAFTQLLPSGWGKWGVIISLVLGSLLLLILKPGLLILVKKRLAALTGQYRMWRPGRLAILLMLAQARYLVFLLQFVLLVMAMGGEWQTGLAAAVAAVFLAKSLLPSIAFSELGIREAAALFFLGGVGYAIPVILLATTLLYSINILLPALLGLPIWQFNRSKSEG